MCAMIIVVSVATAAILIKGANCSEEIENEESARKLKDLSESAKSFITEEQTKDDTEAKRNKDASEKAMLLFYLKDSNHSNC